MSRSKLTLAAIAGAIVLLGIVDPYFPECFAGMGCDNREGARPEVMRSDLRNLAIAQESYYSDSLTYAGSISALYYSTGPGVTNYSTSHGVTVEIVAASDRGWRAVASHELAVRTCAVYVGAVAQPPATREGEPACECPNPRGFWEWLHGRPAVC